MTSRRSAAGAMLIAQAIALAVVGHAAFAIAEPIPPIPRFLPPAGIKLEDAVRKELDGRLDQAQQRFAKHAQHPLAADVEVIVRAVQLALKYDEFYTDQDAKHARELLDLASHRLDELDAGTTPWTTIHGTIVRGYRSSIDGSAQPYGLVIPDGLDLNAPVPLYVWLHGRGDKTTNLSFLHQRLSQPGQVAPPNAIVLHPFGRHCLGYKSAGEIDVLEAVEHVATQYKIDRRRIVLMGFSMGGAGCWHIGAHYPDRWVAMSPGAGFIDTARYQNIDPKTLPWYERRLLGTYDVPAYVRNLFNLPVIAYSGEVDKQRQAAEMMVEAFAAAGQKLEHRIGPGMGHKYHPDTLAAILKDLNADSERGLNPSPSRVTLETQTLRYHKVFWVDIQRLQEHWRDSRVDAERPADDKLQVTTRNIAALQLTPARLPENVEVTIDGQPLRIAPRKDETTGQSAIRLINQNGRWSEGSPDAHALAKRPALQGPMDDAFLAPFLVVLPSKKCANETVQNWVDFELAHFLDRWESVFCGHARVKHDNEVTTNDMAKYHLILWGDPGSNSALGRIADRLPIHWTQTAIAVGDQRLSSAQHALAMICPNPEAPDHYVVINSGPTFREAHDHTNSQQNPKLPDWAIIDLSQPPDANSPGKIVAADFFDEAWQLRRGGEK